MLWLNSIQFVFENGYGSIDTDAADDDDDNALVTKSNMMNTHIHLNHYDMDRKWYLCKFHSF